jgi:type IV secretory pathway VirB10-like protein
MIRTVAAIAAALTLLTACGGNDDTGTPPPSTPATSAPISTPPPSETPSDTSSTPPASTPTAPPTTPKPPAPTKPPAPKAADGNNLKACSDAICEVYVKTGTRIPVKRSVLGFSTLTVSRVSAGSVDFGGKSSCCSVSAGGQSAGSVFRMNNLKVTTVAVTGAIAILRLHPA